MSFLSTLEPHVFLYILSSIAEGLTALGGQLNHFTGLYGTGTYSSSMKLDHINIIRYLILNVCKYVNFYTIFKLAKEMIKKPPH